MSPIIESIRAEYERYKALAEGAIAQLSDADLHAPAQANSIAIVVWHVSGNLASRFTDFLTTDGEKPDRNRDGEFEVGNSDDRAALERALAEGWHALETALDSIDPAKLEQTVVIRGEPHTVMQAVHRQVAHYASHIGQIVYLAKLWAGGSWKTLSIPKGQSEAFNRKPDKYTGGDRA